MRVIAITNQKGGVGKTTTAINGASVLAKRGATALVVDLDSQGQASEFVGRRINQRPPVYEALARGGPFADHAVATGFGFDILAGGDETAVVESHIVSATSGRGRYVLREAIEEARPLRRWDYVLLDCPPSLGALSMAALIAADTVLVPLPLQSMPKDGLRMLSNAIGMVRAHDNPKAAIGAIFCTMTDLRTNEAGNVRDELAEAYPGLLLETVIRRDTKLSEAFRLQRPVIEVAPDSRAAEDYQALVAELFERGVL